MKEGLNLEILKKMMMMGTMISFSAAAVSCGALSVSANAIGNRIDELKKDPTKLRSNQYALNDQSAPTRGLSALRGGQVSTSTTGGQLQVAEEDIVWAPVDPDVEFTELEGIVVDDANPLDSWFEDYGKALNKARITGKPVMIWFTRSRNSPLCQRLSNELFSQKEFNDWADAHIIRLRVDSNIQESDTAKRRDRERYVAELKKRYRALGQPVVVMISPRGTEFAKYRGYSAGSAEFYFGRLKNAQRTAQADYSTWLSEMEAKGYRTWQNIKRVSVFAKATRYRDGVIWLVEPDGKKSRTPVSKLSTEDRQYVERKLADSRAKKAAGE